MQPEKEKPTRCPTCDSPDPRTHPATATEGEVAVICVDNFHSRQQDTTGQPTPQQRDVRYY